jgi:serine/threonine-protein kinase
MFDIALQEYRRIGQSFPGRMEGREALFRAGLTLLEKGRVEPKFYSAALKEFEKLFKTPGAPLEYLGKSMVYEAMGDSE